MTFSIRHRMESDQVWLTALLRKRWGSVQIVTRGQIHQANILPALVAERAGERCGLLTYHIVSDECEIVSLDSLIEQQGVASVLLDAVQSIAKQAGCKRLWLITTNDNSGAIEFYLRRGFSLIAVHQGVVAQSRRLKPAIPTHSAEGIAIDDEWEFERRL